jgi:hypothetical protein
MRLANGRQLSAWPRASPFLSHEILQRRIVQHGVGQQPFQPRVLVLQRPQPLGLRDLQPAELGFPFVNAGVADAMLAAQIGDRTPASCSFKIPMICSSEKRLRFMLWSLSWARTNFKGEVLLGLGNAQKPHFR